MNTAEAKLQERIKELTCLYEVSSIIVNAEYEHLDETFRAIALSLKKAFQFSDMTEIGIETEFEPDLQRHRIQKKTFSSKGFIRTLTMDG